MLPRFPAGKGKREIGSKRKGKRGKEEFLKGKCNQDESSQQLDLQQLSQCWCYDRKPNIYSYHKNTS